MRRLAFALLAACGSPFEIPGEGVSGRVDDGALSLVADEGGTLLGGMRFALGRADETVEHQFGAFRFVETNRVLDGASLSRELVLSAGDQTVGNATLTFGPDAATLVITATRAGDDRISVSFACRDDEHFLGLGGQSFDVDHRGQNVPIWVSEDGIGKSATDEIGGLWFLEGRRHTTHTPIPAYLSSRGYSLVVGGSRYSVFDLCAADPDRVSIEVWGPRLELTVFAAPHPKDGVRALSQHFGAPRLPPPFTFAPWLDALYGSANVRRVADALRAADVPVSVIWTEDWRGGDDSGNEYVLEEDWELDRALYPDFEALAGDLHDAGYKFLVYYNSFLMSSTGTYAEAVAGGYTIRDAAGEPYHFMGATFEPTSLLDFSNPAAYAWGKSKLATAIALGADGWMADFAEWLPTDAVLASGQDPFEAHNLYPVEWARLNQEVLDEGGDGVDRLFFLRAAYSGSQPLVSVVWAGDQQTDFSKGDGYPSVIPMGIGLGIVGFPYYGHDIGGYMSIGTIPTTEELWRRWVTLGALSPVMRTHHGRRARDNWSWETDAAATEHFRRWAKLHIRLFPYFYALAADPGLPMMRPLALEHPDFEPGWTSTDQYLLGDRILVAPVVEKGATSRRVGLPPGDWYPLLGGPALRGSPMVDAPATEIPAFVPAGAMLVLLPEAIDTLAPASDADVVTLDDVGEDREIWIWPGGDSELVEAGGLRYEWRGGGLTGRPNSAMWNGVSVPVAEAIPLTGSGTLTLDGATLTITGRRPDRALVVRLHGVPFEP